MYNGRCSQNIGNAEKKWTPEGFQMCKFCADVRDNLLTEGPASTSAARRDVRDARPPPPPRSSSSSQLEERVRTLETLVEDLQQAISSRCPSPFEERVRMLATLVKNLEQKLVQALQRVAELEATVENWQQWPQQW